MRAPGGGKAGGQAGEKEEEVDEEKEVGEEEAGGAPPVPSLVPLPAPPPPSPPLPVPLSLFAPSAPPPRAEGGGLEIFNHLPTLCMYVRAYTHTP